MPCFAEKGGFEPPVQLPVRQFSKLLVSATHPSLQFLNRQRLYRELGLQKYTFFFKLPNIFATKIQIMLHFSVNQWLKNL